MAFVKTERLGDTAVEARFLDFVHTLALQDGQEEPEQNAERQAHSREVKGKRELPWQIFLRAARVKPLHCDLRCNFDQRGDCVEEDASDERHPPQAPTRPPCCAAAARSRSQGVVAAGNIAMKKYIGALRSKSFMSIALLRPSSSLVSVW